MRVNTIWYLLGPEDIAWPIADPAFIVPDDAGNTVVFGTCWAFDRLVATEVFGSLKERGKT